MEREGIHVVICGVQLFYSLNVMHINIECSLGCSEDVKSVYQIFLSLMA